MEEQTAAAVHARKTLRGHIYIATELSSPDTWWAMKTGGSTCVVRKPTHLLANSIRACWRMIDKTTAGLRVLGA
jgi:hypothetical protein